MTDRKTKDAKPQESDLRDLRRKQEVERLYRDYKSQKFPQIKDISPTQLKAKNVRDYVLIDVREPKEMNVSILPGAISKKAFETDKKRFKGKQIIVYCTIGYRSGHYTAKLANEGFAATNLAGSMLAWAHAGFAFSHLGKPTKKMHTYSKEWDYLPLGYEAIIK